MVRCNETYAVLHVTERNRCTINMLTRYLQREKKEEGRVASPVVVGKPLANGFRPWNYTDSAVQKIKR